MKCDNHKEVRLVLKSAMSVKNTVQGGVVVNGAFVLSVMLVSITRDGLVFALFDTRCSVFDSPWKKLPS